MSSLALIGSKQSYLKKFSCCNQGSFAVQRKLRRYSSCHALDLEQVTLPPWAFREDLKSEIHVGYYGDWTIDNWDVAEVIGYRAGIIVTALCILAIFAACLGDSSAVSGTYLNVLCLLGTVSFATSLVLIHIYVTEIKQTFQILLLMGAVGETWLMATQSGPVVSFVAEHPWATLLVGPAFAAATGVAIKEGLCYGKLEAAGLALVTPVWLLGHLTTLLPPATDEAFAACFVAIFTIFAARKCTQSIKDDIGDKSVFTFQAMSEEKQEALLRELKRINNGEEGSRVLKKFGDDDGVR